MRGQILIDKELGWRWIYVPEAHIQFCVAETGTKNLFIAAFRTDGYRRTAGGPVPMEQWLHENHQFTKELEVPDDIVQFAVQSEADRQRAVEGLTEQLKEVAEEEAKGRGPADPDWLIQHMRKAFEAEEVSPEEEHLMALRVKDLIGSESLQ